MLTRGSAMVLEETNDGPAREAALVLIASAASPAVLHFPQTRVVV